MNMEELQQVFFLECEEAMVQAEAGLLALEAGAGDAETINAVFRAVHSVKGGAGAFGFGGLQAFAHRFESALALLREGSRQAEPETVRLLLVACDMLADHVGAVRDTRGPPDDAELMARLDRLVSGDGPQVSGEATAPGEAALDLDALLAALPPAASDWHVTIAPLDQALANGNEPVLLIRELARLGATITCDTSGVPPLAVFDATHARLCWHATLPASVPRAAVEEVFEFCGDTVRLSFDGAVPDDIAPAASTPPPLPVSPPPAPVQAPAQPADAPPAPPQAAEPARAAPVQNRAIRVDLQKLERLFDTVGEIVIAQSMLAQHLRGHASGAGECLGMLDALTRELQDNVMAIRAQPVAAVFSRMPRVVREVAEVTGKAVNIDISGDATELDKLVVERLAEPLTHLIRNAVDHGLEDPAARQAAGKPPTGRLQLAAGHRNGRIYITLADDGRGIDRTRVRAKAIEAGLVSADAVLTDEEIDHLIFAPGFSTAAQVSNISGRGVGMDVVRQTVKELGGRITIQSQPGLGSVFTITLPLTLAIADAMVVQVGAETLVVPLLPIVETLRATPAVLRLMGKRQMLNLRDSFIPVVDLGELHGTGTSDDGVLIVVETETAGRAALRVDAILDSRQVVIKSLEHHYRAVPSVAGATILGDGQVAVIVDVEAVVAQSLAWAKAA
jgi:two-component system chemotaxis sensor kinase CheA